MDSENSQKLSRSDACKIASYVVTRFLGLAGRAAPGGRVPPDPRADEATAAAVRELWCACGRTEVETRETGGGHALHAWMCGQIDDPRGGVYSDDTVSVAVATLAQLARVAAATGAFGDGAGLVTRLAPRVLAFTDSVLYYARSQLREEWPAVTYAVTSVSKLVARATALAARTNKSRARVVLPGTRLVFATAVLVSGVAPSVPLPSAGEGARDAHERMCAGGLETLLFGQWAWDPCARAPAGVGPALCIPAGTYTLDTRGFRKSGRCGPARPLFACKLLCLMLGAYARVAYDAYTTGVNAYGPAVVRKDTELASRPGSTYAVFMVVTGAGPLADTVSASISAGARASFHEFPALCPGLGRAYVDADMPVLFEETGAACTCAGQVCTGRQERLLAATHAVAAWARGYTDTACPGLALSFVSGSRVSGDGRGGKVSLHATVDALVCSADVVPLSAALARLLVRGHGSGHTLAVELDEAGAVVRAGGEDGGTEPSGMPVHGACPHWRLVVLSPGGAHLLPARIVDEAVYKKHSSLRLPGSPHAVYGAAAQLVPLARDAAWPDSLESLIARNGTVYYGAHAGGNALYTSCTALTREDVCAWAQAAEAVAALCPYVGELGPISRLDRGRRPTNGPPPYSARSVLSRSETEFVAPPGTPASRIQKEAADTRALSRTVRACAGDACDNEAGVAVLPEFARLARRLLVYLRERKMTHTAWLHLGTVYARMGLTEDIVAWRVREHRRHSSHRTMSPAEYTAYTRTKLTAMAASDRAVEPVRFFVSMFAALGRALALMAPTP